MSKEEVIRVYNNFMKEKQIKNPVIITNYGNIEDILGDILNSVYSQGYRKGRRDGFNEGHSYIS